MTLNEFEPFLMADYRDIRLALIEMKSKFALLKYEREMEVLSM